jgi:hypothetical protein
MRSRSLGHLDICSLGRWPAPYPTKCLIFIIVYPLVLCLFPASAPKICTVDQVWQWHKQRRMALVALRLSLGSTALFRTVWPAWFSRSAILDTLAYLPSMPVSLERTAL